MTNFSIDAALLRGSIFALLVAFVFANIWFASAPLPLGGPNVWLSGAAILLAIAYANLRVLRNENISIGVSALLDEFRPLVPAISVATLLLAWVLAVYLFTDTLDATRLAQTFLGIGVLFAVCLCVDSVRRMKIMALAIVVATFASALFGFAVAYIGEPFLTVWTHISNVRDIDISVIFHQGRMSGFIPTTSIFAHQLVVAIPFAFAALVFSPFARGLGSATAGRAKLRCRAYDVALAVMMLAMITALVFNASRSAILGLLASAVIIIIPLSFSAPRFRKRLLVIVSLTVVWLLAIYIFIIDGIPQNSIENIYAYRETVADAYSSMNGSGYPMIGHIIEGLTPSKGFMAQVRSKDAPESDVTTIADSSDTHGSLALIWREPEDYDNQPNYEFRLLREDKENWGPWLDICFYASCSYMSSRGPIIHDLVVARGGNGMTVSHTISGLEPKSVYRSQVRARNEHGYGVPRETVGESSADGGLSLAWREDDTFTDVSAYQLRLLEGGRTSWTPWRDFVPSVDSVYGAPPPPIYKLAIGIHTLQNRSNGPSIGHTIYLNPNKKFALQLRTRNDHAFGIETNVVANVDDNGEMAFTWLEPAVPENIAAYQFITDYQFRIRPHGETEWRPWRDFTPLLRSDERSGAEAAEAYEISALSVQDMKASSERIFSYSDVSAQSRIHMARVALRYSLDYPLGTGVYHPNESHVVGISDTESARRLLIIWPHNQFLYMLVLFGFPGMILLMLFYLFILRSMIRSAIYIIRSQSSDHYFLIVAVAAAMASYTFISLVFPSGPFIVDWSHFLLIGMAFSIQKIIASRKANGEFAQP